MKHQRLNSILVLLQQHYADAKIALVFNSPFQLLIATILSAQCTDKVVNEVTPSLFRLYPTVQSLGEAPVEEIEEAIRRIGLFRNKARFIKATASRIADVYAGQVPDSMVDLLTLPGVARKTANVVLQNAFSIAEGVVVDTHIGRVSFRLGLTKEQDPRKIEQDLVRLLPAERRKSFSHEVIAHGRAICKAPRPRCATCFLKDLCPQKGVKKAP